MRPSEIFNQWAAQFKLEPINHPYLVWMLTQRIAREKFNQLPWHQRFWKRLKNQAP